jgi:hypothetical protein
MQHVAPIECQPMAYDDLAHQNSVTLGPWQNARPEAASLADPPPPWLAASSAEFRLTLRLLTVVGPIRAIFFGGALVFVALLGFLLGHSPVGQTTLAIISLCGLPICIVGWFVASSACRRLRRKRNRIERRMHSAGMHVDQQGRVLTDNPHPILIFDPATAAMHRIASSSVMEGS